MPVSAYSLWIPPQARLDGPDAPLSDISDEAKQSFEVAVRPVPQYDPENMQMISAGTLGLCFLQGRSAGGVGVLAVYPVPSDQRRADFLF